MPGRQIPRRGLLLSAVLLIGISLACNLPKTNDQIKWFLDNYLGRSDKDMSREDVLAYFESMEGMQDYDVAADPMEIQADCVPNHATGNGIPVEVNHIPGKTPTEDKVIISDANGVREYQYSSIRDSEPFLYCRSSLDLPGAECVRFTTSWRYELIVYEDHDWPSTKCYQATYQTSSSAAEDEESENEQTTGLDHEGVIIAKGIFEIPCEDGWTNTENTLELQLDPFNKVVQGTGTVSCFKIENIHDDRETRTDAVTTFTFSGEVDSPTMASGNVKIAEEGWIGDYVWEEETEVPFQWTALYEEGKIEGFINSPGNMEQLPVFGKFTLTYEW
jgi:hypothetical protein